MTLNEIVILLAAIAAIVTSVAAWIKTNPEIRNLNGDIVGKYQAIVDKSADRETTLMNKNDALEVRVEALEKELAETNARLAKIENYNMRLVAQLESENIIPIPFEIVVRRRQDTGPR